jgi:peptide/nickel transport system substrate-binding protein
MGTGPFMFAHLDRANNYWDANSFVGYWRGWPADWSAYAYASPKGYIDHLTVTWAYSWAATKAAFLNGDVDLFAVPRNYSSEAQNQNGIHCIYPLPNMSVDGLFFNYNIDWPTPLGTVFNYDFLGENGIPRDFFGNVT